MSVAIEASDLAIGYHGRRVGTDISLGIEKGEVLCLLGPNGSGKTTLFKTLLGLLPPLAGTVRVLGEPVAGWSRAAFARKVGYVPQAHAGIFPFSVEEIVLMGRAARIERLPRTPGRTKRSPPPRSGRHPAAAAVTAMRRRQPSPGSRRRARRLAGDRRPWTALMETCGRTARPVSENVAEIEMPETAMRQFLRP